MPHATMTPPATKRPLGKARFRARRWQFCPDAHRPLRYVEDMISKQVIAAIGRSLTPTDMGDYMAFHTRRLYAAQYLPKPFCYDVRRAAGFSPEGSLQIGLVGGAPVATACRVLPPEAAPEMRFALSASTEVSFKGEHRLHGLLRHSFSGGGGVALEMRARARQFSSFVLLVGRVAAADVFEPKHAIIIKDKDDVIIPLLADPLPTAGEFRDAIASLSPVQRRFAQAYRSMQLESTLFACCIVQIKPQLELLLGLPEGALTKEIALTQQLMELFIDYQVCAAVVVEA